MSNGKQDVPRPERLPESSVTAAYLLYARWLLGNPAVLEVWAVTSDLPEIGTPEAAVTLDAGTWFLCRLALPPLPGGHAIISFVPQLERPDSVGAQEGEPSDVD